MLISGAATAIGSLPDLDVAAAVDRALRTAPDLPTVPTLPGRTAAASLLGEIATAVPGIELDAGGLVVVHEPGPPHVEIDAETDAGLIAFCDRIAGRTEPVKAQIVGPATATVALQRAGVDPADAAALAVEVTSRRADVVIDRIRASAPEAPVVLSLDEPLLTTLSSDRPELAVTDAIDLVATVFAGYEDRALPAVHCCGPTDWAALLQTGPAVLFAPLGQGLESYPGSLASFLDRDGWVGWGVVPTDGPVGTTADRSWKRLATTWCDLVRQGCDPVRIRTQALVTPDCGLAGHGTSQADRVLGLVADVSQRIHDQLVAVRFAMGA